MFSYTEVVWDRYTDVRRILRADAFQTPLFNEIEYGKSFGITTVARAKSRGQGSQLCAIDIVMEKFKGIKDVTNSCLAKQGVTPPPRLLL